MAISAFDKFLNDELWMKIWSLNHLFHNTQMRIKKITELLQMHPQVHLINLWPQNLMICSNLPQHQIQLVLQRRLELNQNRNYPNLNKEQAVWIQKKLQNLSNKSSNSIMVDPSLFQIKRKNHLQIRISQWSKSKSKSKEFLIKLSALDQVYSEVRSQNHS